MRASEPCVARPTFASLLHRESSIHALRCQQRDEREARKSAPCASVESGRSKLISCLTGPELLAERVEEETVFSPTSERTVRGQGSDTRCAQRPRLSTTGEVRRAPPSLRSPVSRPDSGWPRCGPLDLASRRGREICDLPRAVTPSSGAVARLADARWTVHPRRTHPHRLAGPRANRVGRLFLLGLSTVRLRGRK